MRTGGVRASSPSLRTLIIIVSSRSTSSTSQHQGGKRKHSMAERQAWRSIYFGLLLVRLTCALLGTGYVHPDEWMQSGEALLGDLLGIPTMRAWEFEPRNPCRSLASLYIFNVPLVLLVKAYSALGTTPSAYTLFLVQRATSFALSLVLDYSAYALISPTSRSKSQSYKLLSLLGSSHGLLSLYTRPFSNGVEAALVGVVLVLTRNILSVTYQWPQMSEFAEVQLRQRWSSTAALLGAVGSLGIFVRFTFPIFVLPAACVALHSAWVLSTSPGISTASRLLRLQSFLLEPASAFILLTLLLSSLDSWLYGHGAFLSTAPTFAPLNALLYNLDSSNLATHGTHPRWLHVCVNAPIILGVPQCLDAVERAVKWCTSRKAQRSRNRKGKGKEVELDEAQVLSNSMRKLYIATILTSLALLSLQPHQEPRFLLPLVLPSTLLFAESFFGSGMGRARLGRRTRKIYASLHLIQQTLLVVLFSFLHHASLLPSLFALNQDLRSTSPLPSWVQSRNVATHDTPKLHIGFWRTFMPPRHLLLDAPKRESWAKARVQDHGSTEARALAELLLSRSPISSNEQDTTLQLLVAPFWALSPLRESLGARAELDIIRTHGPALDMDHMPEMLEAWKGGLSVREAGGLAVLLVRPKVGEESALR